jgi:hypothetical protein
LPRASAPTTAANPNTTSGLVESSTTQPAITRTTANPASTAETLHSAGTTSTITTTATTTTVTKPGALEFVDGKLLGIAQYSLLTFAAQVLGVTPVPLYDQEFDPPVHACTGTLQPWVIRSGGLTLVFEGSSADTAVLTNWTYTGGPAAGFTEIVAPYDIRIGDPRSKLEAANPDRADYVNEIHVGTPFYLRYGLENDVVNWFGIIDCVFEQNPDS